MNFIARNRITAGWVLGRGQGKPLLRPHRPSRHSADRAPERSGEALRSRPGRKCNCPASDSRRRCPEHVHRAADAPVDQCPIRWRGRPQDRQSSISNPVSAPGSASPGNGRPDSMISTVTPGSPDNGSRSSKLAIRPSRGTAIFKAPPGRLVMSITSSAGSRHAPANHGTTPRDGPTGVAGHFFQASVEEAWIAAELVDQERLDAVPISLAAALHGCRPAAR